MPLLEEGGGRPLWMKETFSWVGVAECKMRGTPRFLQASPDLKRDLTLLWAVTADGSAAQPRSEAELVALGGAGGG